MGRANQRAVFPVLWHLSADFLADVSRGTIAKDTAPDTRQTAKIRSMNLLFKVVCLIAIANSKGLVTKLRSYEPNTQE